MGTADKAFGLNKILCPTDFSDGSHSAVRYALSLAERVSGSIDLVHICDVPHYVRPDLMVWVESGGARPMSEIAREQAEAEMSQLLAALSPEQRELVTPTVHIGDPAASILTIAETHKSTLIVMGTHGRSALEQLVLGSIAEKIVRRAHCPVLVVRPPPPEDPTPTGPTA